jgi:3-hydroxyacyl-CoA dehydrogenase
MGMSISACLLAAGHPVVGVTGDLERRHHTKRRIMMLLREMKRQRSLAADLDALTAGFRVSADFAALADCEIVLESVTANEE